ncbi:MAG: hypothetical protein K0S75_2548 [Clostridia bacterium]|jgi:hypothetical protein|nr:hypothetical protein [Clostridia bacterium]
MSIIMVLRKLKDRPLKLSLQSFTVNAIRGDLLTKALPLYNLLYSHLIHPLLF